MKKLNLIDRPVLIILRIAIMVSAILLLAVFLAPTPEKNMKVHPNATFDPVSYTEYTRPLKNAEGDTYCSSSSVKYKGSVFTLTNNHCCDGGDLEFGIDERRVGNSIETIIHQSKDADVCVLTSSQYSTPIKLAEKEFEYFDVTIVMGYPKGLFLTLSNGRLGMFNSSICFYDVMKTPPKECFNSNKISNAVFPGNSGSPVFNNKGELTNLVYASHMFPTFIGLTVPYKNVKEALDKAISVKK